MSAEKAAISVPLPLDLPDVPESRGRTRELHRKLGLEFGNGRLLTEGQPEDFGEGVLHPMVPNNGCCQSGFADAPHALDAKLHALAAQAHRPVRGQKLLAQFAQSYTEFP